MLLATICSETSGHTRAEQHLTCGPESLPCGQPQVFQLLWLRSAAQQGNCGFQGFCSPLQEAPRAGLSSHSTARLAAGRLPWCAVSLVGEDGLSCLCHSLLEPQLALFRQCLADLCSSSSRGGQLRVLLRADVQPGLTWSRINSLPLVLQQQLHVSCDCPHSPAQAKNCRPLYTGVPCLPCQPPDSRPQVQRCLEPWLWLSSGRRWALKPCFLSLPSTAIALDLRGTSCLRQSPQAGLLKLVLARAGGCCEQPRFVGLLVLIRR